MKTEARALTVRLKCREVPFAWVGGHVQQRWGLRSEDPLGQEWPAEVSWRRWGRSKASVWTWDG